MLVENNLTHVLRYCVITNYLLMFVGMGRERIFVILVHESAGGARAADWIASALEKILEELHRQDTATPVWDLIEPWEDREDTNPPHINCAKKVPQIVGTCAAHLLHIVCTFLHIFAHFGQHVFAHIRCAKKR